MVRESNAEAVTLQGVRLRGLPSFIEDFSSDKLFFLLPFDFPCTFGTYLQGGAWACPSLDNSPKQPKRLRRVWLRTSGRILGVQRSKRIRRRRSGVVRRHCSAPTFPRLSKHYAPC